MKSIAISFIEENGHAIRRYSAIKSTGKFGMCELTDKAKNYILAQTKDGKVYQGIEESDLYAYTNGDLNEYWYYRDNTLDDSIADAFGFDKSPEKGKVQLRVIEIMED